MKRRELLCAAAVLFLAGAGVGLHGADIVRDGFYTRKDRLRSGEYKVYVTRGPEAAAWGWTLVAGAAATLAWSAILAFPPVPRPRVHHFGLVGIAFLAVAATFGLRMPPVWPPPDPRSAAFYASLAFMLLSLGVLALLKERGLPVVGGALVAAVAAALWFWGLKGFEGMGLSLMAACLLGLHVAAYAVLVRSATSGQTSTRTPLE